MKLYNGNRSEMRKSVVSILLFVPERLSTEIMVDIRCSVLFVRSAATANAVI